MLIAVDVDGIIRNFIGSLIKVYKEEYPNHKILPITGWPLEDFFPIGLKIYDFIYVDKVKEIFYDNALPYDGVIEGINKLKENHDIIFLSVQRPSSAKWTSEWLKKYGFDDIRTIYVDRSIDKLLYFCDLFIDDKFKTIKNLNELGKHAILMDRPWNQNDDKSVIRVYSFAEFVDYVEGLNNEETGNSEASC